MFSETCAQRPSQFPTHQDQQPLVMDRVHPQPAAPAPHRRAISEPVNVYYRHKHLPRLPHEIEPYRSRSLPEIPLEANRRSLRPQSKYAPDVPPYKNRPLPPPPLRTSEPARRETRTVETLCVVETESRILLLKCERVDSWEEKLAFAREMQDRWTKGTRFAHEIRECTFDCACGMV